MNNETLKRDLCARLMDGVKVLDILEGNEISIEYTSQTYDTKKVGLKLCIERNERFKPYLFPISAITKSVTIANYNNGKPFVPIEEAKRVTNITISSKTIVMLLESDEFEVIPFGIIDLLNRWKIDYRNLIGQGLAIEVTEENNPYK